MLPSAILRARHIESPGHPMPQRARQRGFAVRGDLLRRLRTERGWSREQAAHHAGVSEKLLAKAEGGGRIDAKSASVMAAMYDTADRPLSITDILAAPTAASQHSSADDADTELLAQWLMGIWSGDWFLAVDRLAAEPLRFQCELGLLTSREQLRQRAKQFRIAFTDLELNLDTLAHSEDRAVGRWCVSMTHTGRWHGSEPTCSRVSMLGTTTIRSHAGQIIEAWEYWSPQLSYHAIARRIGEAGWNAPHFTLTEIGHSERSEESSATSDPSLRSG